MIAEIALKVTISFFLITEGIYLIFQENDVSVAKSYTN